MAIVDAAAEIASRLAGRSVLRTERGEDDWAFHFADEVWLRAAACPWRIILNRKIALGNSDHAQNFGLPEPIDGQKESDRLLCNKTVQTLRIREGTGDLAIDFTEQTTLEILNISSGYEGWRLGDRTGFVVIALGGGELALWTRR